MLPDLAAALSAIGSSDESTAVLREAHARAEEIADPEIAADVTVRQGFMTADRGGEPDRVRSEALEAAAVFERSGNENGLSRAWQLIGSVEWDLGQAGRQLKALDQALEHAQRANNSYETAQVLHEMTSAIVRGPTPVGEGIDRVESILEQYRGNRGAEASTGHALAHLRARLGDFDGARGEVTRYRTFQRDTGQVIGYGCSAEVLFDVEMIAGQVRTANAVAEEATAALLEHGVR